MAAAGIVGAAPALGDVLLEALGDALAVPLLVDDAAEVLDCCGFGFGGSPEQPAPTRPSTTREAAGARLFTDTVATPCVDELPGQQPILSDIPDTGCLET